jgi:hypothetical protein
VVVGLDQGQSLAGPEWRERLAARHTGWWQRHQWLAQRWARLRTEVHCDTIPRHRGHDRLWSWPTFRESGGHTNPAALPHSIRSRFDLLHHVAAGARLDLPVPTMGGDVDATEKTVLMLRKATEPGSELRVIVPDSAKSAPGI